MVARRVDQRMLSYKYRNLRVQMLESHLICNSVGCCRDWYILSDMDNLEGRYLVSLLSDSASRLGEINQTFLLLQRKTLTSLLGAWVQRQV